MCIAWHNVFTSCLENSHACYVNHMYSGFVFQAEVWYLFTKQYNFLAAKIKACLCLFQEWMPQNDFSALHYICHHEIDTYCMGSDLYWNINIPKNINIYRTYPLQSLYAR